MNQDQDKDKWIIFWEESAENANEAIRYNKILSNGTIGDKTNINKIIYDYYLESLKLMDKQIFNQVTKSRNSYFRNVNSDIYFDNEIGDEITNQCYTSCFKDKFDKEFGIFEITVYIPMGFSFLEYGSNIIFPAGRFRLTDKKEDSYTIEMIESLPLFRD